MFRGVTVRDALQGAETAIGASGSGSARLDAELLLAHVLGVDRTRLFLDDGLTVEGPAVRAYQDLVRRRSVGREPVAYLLGRQGFRHLELEVDERVLIPRPETEHAVEAVVELAPHGARVVDVGTGSGAIALALKHERPDLDVTGSDISSDALDVARANAARLALDVTCVLADGVPNPQPTLLKGSDPFRWDVVVSNPPYVAEGDPRVAADVRAHEPHQALYAGADGLDVIRRLISGPPTPPAPLLVLEVGEGQDQEVARLATQAGYARVAVRADLAGIARIVIAWA
jgi:release factor glutamine methyltransferase